MGALWSRADQPKYMNSQVNFVTNVILDAILGGAPQMSSALQSAIRRPWQTVVDANPHSEDIAAAFAVPHEAPDQIVRPVRLNYVSQFCGHLFKGASDCTAGQPPAKRRK